MKPVTNFVPEKSALQQAQAPRASHHDARDKNEAEIVRYFVAEGWAVRRLPRGNGADLICYSPSGGRTETVEVKMPGAITLSESEKTLRYELERRGIPYRIMQSVKDARAIVEGL